MKEQFHEQLERVSTPQIQKVSEYHILGLIKKFPELPLFIYSKIFERVNKEYGNLFHKYNSHKDNSYDVPFYDYYSELYKEINDGNYDQEIKEYMKDVLKSYGIIYCTEFLDMKDVKTFDKETVESPTYWSKEYAEDWLNRMKSNPDYDAEHCAKIVKENVEEGVYYEDWSYALNNVLEIIAHIIERELDKITNITNLKVRIFHSIYIMDSHFCWCCFNCRPKEYIKADILKLYIEWKKVEDHLDVTLYDLYDEFDSRFTDRLDYAEEGLHYEGQYDDEFYKDENGELQYKPESEEYESPIPKLESELNRLKGNSA